MESDLVWVLLAIQIAMGAFDTIVHHEGSERLAWRPSQKTELRLHSVRNFFYAVIFLVFAWFEPLGLYAVVLVVILALELLITLWDFVEEDMTRKLPASERINHTLLTLNYGAILAVAAPYFWNWSQMESALSPTSYGWWSVMATFAALGVGVLALRDFLAASRSDRLKGAGPADLVADLPPRQNVLVTGGTGFIGERLVEALVAAGHHVTVLSRNEARAARLSHPVRIISRLDQIDRRDRFDGIVNLAGEPLANWVWTRKKRDRIIRSRVHMTKDLNDLVARLDHKPAVLINGSAIGWYGPRDDGDLTERAGYRDAFVHDVCATWENEAASLEAHGLRVAMLRIGLVLGVEGGVLARLLTPFEFGIGGVMGNGRHWMSWIARDDLIRIISFVFVRPDLSGPINATAPNPARNGEFSVALGQALARPVLLRFPARLLTLGLGDMGREMLLEGQKVVPERLGEAGFVFRYPDLLPMLRNITGAKGDAYDKDQAANS